MSSNNITAIVEEVEGKQVLLSPSVGRLAIVVKEGDMIKEGQVIGHVHLLNKRYQLIVPEDCYGQIAFSDQSQFMLDVEFKSIIATVNPHGIKQGIADRKNRTVKKDLKGEAIDAPMDGMFYLSPSPDEPPFVKVGDTISPGQTVGLIEVMKCFYPIKFQGTTSKKITGIVIKDKTPVNSGTKLFSIDQ
jgi:biotin carboxyl carrier protein